MSNFPNFFKWFFSFLSPFQTLTLILNIHPANQKKKKKKKIESQWYKYAFSIRSRLVEHEPLVMSLQFVRIASILVSISVLLINFESKSHTLGPPPGREQIGLRFRSSGSKCNIDTCNCLRSTHQNWLNNRRMSIEKETKHRLRGIRKCWEILRCEDDCIKEIWDSLTTFEEVG